MENTPILTENNEILWNNETYNMEKLGKILRRDYKAMVLKKKATVKYRNSAKGRAKQKEANLRYRAKNKS